VRWAGAPGAARTAAGRRESHSRTRSRRTSPSSGTGHLFEPEDVRALAPWRTLGRVLLHPPVPVHLARPAGTIPAGPRWSYEYKLDGWRALVFRGDEDTVHVQTRTGRLLTGALPDLVEAALRLPPGTVLDGELVVWLHGRIDFAAVQRRALASPRRAAALATTMPVTFAAFDVLEHAGEDWRPRPYHRRRDALVRLLAAAEPPVQVVPATTDRELALRWWYDLRGTGVEGLVVKHEEGVYGGRPATRGWWKVKHGEPRR
jgi:ATP-dependent DNA ligase